MANKKKRFRDRYLYRFLIITVCFAMIMSTLATVFVAAKDMNDIVKWVLLGVAILLYVGACIYVYITFKRQQEYSDDE